MTTQDMNSRLVTGALLLAAVFCLSGCSHQYVMKLSNGSHLTAASKPKLQHGFYTFKDAQGREQKISAGRVSEIAPASMATEDKSNKFKTAAPK